MQKRKLRFGLEEGPFQGRCPVVQALNWLEEEEVGRVPRKFSGRGGR